MSAARNKYAKMLKKCPKANAGKYLMFFKNSLTKCKEYSYTIAFPYRKKKVFYLWDVKLQNALKFNINIHTKVNYYMLYATTICYI